MKKILLFILFSSFVCSISAQKSTVNELLTRADRQFDLYAYNLAFQTYERVLQEEKNNAHALARIGDCYIQLNHPEKAVEWYQKAEKTYNMESDVPLRFGKALMNLADYEGAKKQFLLYAEKDEEVGHHFVNIADFAINNARKESQWQVKNEAINTASADYGAAFYNSGIAFNSAGIDIAQKNKLPFDPQVSNYNYLFFSQRDPESYMCQNPTFLRSDIPNNRNEGLVSFSSGGHRVAFCRDNFVAGTRQIAEKGINMGIYFADVEDGVWKNIQDFPYNSPTYATGFPFLSPDGNKLLFASTQPGGFGGWDIYVSSWTSNGWSEPRNFGSPINSPGNEVTPFFHDKEIYFSSDWHNGFGGLDVFRAPLGEETTEVFNLGPGVNSSRDDYGFIFNSNDNIGYLTSTRSGGRGNEDIWMIKKWNDQYDKSLSIAQSNPFPDNSPEFQIYELYLSCAGKDCASQLQEAAQIYDSSPKHTMALEIFYFYFLSIAFEKVEWGSEPGDFFARQCESLLADYEEKKMLFWDETEAYYMQGMDKIDQRKLKDWISLVTGDRGGLLNLGNDYNLSLPQFPFPPPQSSTRKVLDRDIFQNCHSLSDASHIISNALDKCDYEKSYYSIPNGFALVARLEQFDGGNAISFPAPDRWAVTLPPLRDFSEYLKALFFPQEGHYRIVAFLVTDQPFSEKNRTVYEEEAIGWLKSGLNVLPDIIGKLKWTEAYRCTVLVYEFKATAAQKKGKLINSNFSAQTHLERSNLMSALRGGRN